MVTAALFESLRQPLVVLLTVPMALIGVFLLFYFTDASFSREAWIGLITMGGIVVNNAILLVDHVNQLRWRLGLSLRDATVRGTLERVRPILMTSCTTILGLLPLVVAVSGESADSNIWNALGFAIIGGLTSSMVLVLTVTPALYLLVERRMLGVLLGAGLAGGYIVAAVFIDALRQPWPGGLALLPMLLIAAFADWRSGRKKSGGDDDGTGRRLEPVPVPARP
jgi:HAE1 family hydrophobic/amphiphilic exporter-1